MRWLGALFIISLLSCSILQNNAVLYRAGKMMSDTAFLYSLPYQKGASFLVVQGYRSFFSHHDDFAVDFKMKPGTQVHAARGGVVVFTRADYTKGGLSRRYVGKGNGITIQHNDGTLANYWHLQQNGVFVSVGDSVEQGQLIGLSGHTGFSAFPHLHFKVTNPPHIGGDVAILFKTEKGAKFLQPLRRYKAL